jgi:hypothetical protein
MADAIAQSRLLLQREDSSEKNKIEDIDSGVVRGDVVVGRLQQEGCQSHTTYTASTTACTYRNSGRQPQYDSTGPNNDTVVANHKFHRHNDRRLGHCACVRFSVYRAGFVYNLYP